MALRWALEKLSGSPDIRRAVFFLFAALVAVALRLSRVLGSGIGARRRDTALWPESPPSLEAPVLHGAERRSQGVQAGSRARLEGSGEWELEMERAKSSQMLSLGSAALARVAELESLVAAQEEGLAVLGAERARLLSEVEELKTSLAVTQDALFVASSSALGLAGALEETGQDPGQIVECIDHDRIYQRHCLSVGSLNSAPATARYFAQLGRLLGVSGSRNVLLQVVKRHSRLKR